MVATKRLKTRVMSTTNRLYILNKHLDNQQRVKQLQ